MPSALTIQSSRAREALCRAHGHRVTSDQGPVERLHHGPIFRRDPRLSRRLDSHPESLLGRHCTPHPPRPHQRLPKGRRGNIQRRRLKSRLVSRSHRQRCVYVYAVLFPSTLPNTPYHRHRDRRTRPRERENHSPLQRFRGFTPDRSTLRSRYVATDPYRSLLSLIPNSSILDQAQSTNSAPPGPEYDALLPPEKRLVGSRSIIMVDVYKISTVRPRSMIACITVR